MGMLDDSDPAGVGFDPADLSADDVDALAGEAVEWTRYPAGCPLAGHEPQQRGGEQVIPLAVDDRHPVLFGQFLAQRPSGDHAAHPATQHQHGRAVGHGRLPRSSRRAATAMEAAPMVVYRAKTRSRGAMTRAAGTTGGCW